MNGTPYPGYEYHLNLYQILAEGNEEEKAADREAQNRYISECILTEGLKIEQFSY